MLSVYYHPQDYPNNVVIRRWNVKNAIPVPTQDCLLFDSVKQAHNAIMNTGQWIPIGRDNADVKCLYCSYIQELTDISLMKIYNNRVERWRGKNVHNRKVH